MVEPICPNGESKEQITFKLPSLVKTIAIYLSEFSKASSAVASSLGRRSPKAA